MLLLDRLFHLGLGGIAVPRVGGPFYIVMIIYLFIIKLRIWNTWLIVGNGWERELGMERGRVINDIKELVL